MEKADAVIEDLLSKDIGTVQETDKNKRGKVDIKDINSVFEANIRMLKEKLLKYKDDDTKNRNTRQYAKDLMDYFGKNIYVVVLKTDDEKLPLPEVVNIFNTINTTGMDLNSEDIFKFQYYDYLFKNYKIPEAANNDDYWIEKINSCYKKIEVFNEGKPIKQHISMTDVLSVYQHCICAKYEDNYKVLAKSPERFFSDLFAEPSKYSDLLEFSEFSRLVDEFIAFYSELEENKYNYIRFETKEEIEKYMPLEVTPQPDTMIRIVMNFKPLKETIKIKEQKLETPIRTGFTVVEWGGSIIQ